MPKPDMVLRNRPLHEAEEVMARLKRVVLFHPDPLIMKLDSTYCVCGKGVRKRGKKTKRMICCDKCLEWFYFDCVGLPDDCDVSELDWKCEWCLSKLDKEGRQAWRTGRKKAKYRHRSDRPVDRGATNEGSPPPRYSTPPKWDDRRALIEELSRRKGVKKRKLMVRVQELSDEGGHHLVDAEGPTRLQLRPVDDTLVDDFVGAGLVNPNEVDDE